jgi:hypothetical protein
MTDGIKDLKGTEMYYHGICLKEWEKTASLTAARDPVSKPRRGPPERSTPVRLLAAECLFDDAASNSDHMKSGDRMMANNEFVKMWKESIAV